MYSTSEKLLTNGSRRVLSRNGSSQACCHWPAYLGIMGNMP